MRGFAIYKISGRALIILTLLFLSGTKCQTGTSEDDQGGPSRVTPVVKAFKNVSPAVVNISAVPDDRLSPFPKFSRGTRFNEFFQDFFGSVENSLGSGIIIHPEGFIITNEHVVLDTIQIKVTLIDGREFEAEVWGSDPKSDLAVLKINSKKPLPYVKMSRSDDLMIGETVIAIGNPFGLGHTCSTGIISSLRRSIQVDTRVYQDFIQIDASVNPGNSGGPLLNIKGELIGVTTAIYQKAQGIGFAIPIDRAKRIVDDLIQFREVHKGWIGIEVKDLTQNYIRSSGYKGRGGVIVVKIAEGGPASKAKVEPGDIIESLNATPVVNKENYNSMMGNVTVNDRLELILFREGNRLKASMVATEFPRELVTDLVWDRMGIEVREGKYKVSRQSGEKEYSVVIIQRIDPKGPAPRFGLSPGDIILSVNRDPTPTLEDFYHTIIKNRDKESILLYVRSRGSQIPLAFQMR